MKRLLYLTLCAALLSGCAAPAAAPPTPEAVSPAASAAAPPQTDYAGQYRAEKLGDISDLILARSVIPSDYFRFVEDTALVEGLERYNELTAQLTLTATKNAARLLSNLTLDDPELSEQLVGLAGAHLEVPAYLHDMEARIAHLALYDNAAELCQADPLLSHIIAAELGGSWAMWPNNLHSFGYADTHYSDLFQEYLDLIDSLFTELTGVSP